MKLNHEMTIENQFIALNVVKILLTEVIQVVAITVQMSGIVKIVRDFIQETI